MVWVISNRKVSHGNTRPAGGEEFPKLWMHCVVAENRDALRSLTVILTATCWRLLPIGSLFVFTGSSGVEFLDGLTIPNSICWSPDRKNMYVTHSTARTIFAFDYDASASTATNQRVFYQHDGPGEPDGCRVDVEGNLWHAVYGEGRMLKISPAGKLVGEVRFPTKNITCPEFVGTKLYVTTAGMDDGDGNEEQRNLAGDLFVVDVGVEGTERFRFRLDEK